MCSGKGAATRQANVQGGPGRSSCQRSGSGGVREPQLFLANDATMRQPAGAGRRHTCFCRSWLRIRVPPERSAICSARQVCWPGLRCHRWGSRILNLSSASAIWSFIESSPGRLWGAPRLRSGPGGLVRARRCSTVIGVVNYDVTMKRDDSQRRGRPLRVQQRASKWLDLFRFLAGINRPFQTPHFSQAVKFNVCCTSIVARNHAAL